MPDGRPEFVKNRIKKEAVADFGDLSDFKLPKVKTPQVPDIPKSEKGISNLFGLLESKPEESEFGDLSDFKLPTVKPQASTSKPVETIAQQSTPAVNKAPNVITASKTKPDVEPKFDSTDSGNLSLSGLFKDTTNPDASFGETITSFIKRGARTIEPPLAIISGVTELIGRQALRSKSIFEKMKSGKPISTDDFIEAGLLTPHGLAQDTEDIFKNIPKSGVIFGDFTRENAPEFLQGDEEQQFKSFDQVAAELGVPEGAKVPDDVPVIGGLSVRNLTAFTMETLIPIAPGSKLIKAGARKITPVVSDNIDKTVKIIKKGNDATPKEVNFAKKIVNERGVVQQRIAREELQKSAAIMDEISQRSKKTLPMEEVGEAPNIQAFELERSRTPVDLDLDLDVDNAGTSLTKAEQKSLSKDLPNEKGSVSVSVKSKPIKDIKLDIKRFQPRSAAFSEATAKSIAESKDAIPAVTIWKDPKTQSEHVLDGFSRIEGAKRRGVDNIPTKEFKGTEAQAREFAAAKGGEAGIIERTSVDNFVRQQHISTGLKNDIIDDAGKFFGSDNRIFTREGVALRTERLRKRTLEGALTLQSGGLKDVVPNIADLAYIGAYWVEGGIKNFGKWSKQMVDEFGPEIKPHINTVWRETQKQVKLIPLKADLSTTVGKISKTLDNIDDLQQGTFVDKKVRRDLAKGEAASSQSFVNRNVVQRTNQDLLRAGKELKRLKNLAATQADASTAAALKVADEAFQVALARRQEAARTASESLHEFTKNVEQFKNIIELLPEAEKIQGRLAVLDSLWLNVKQRKTVGAAKDFINYLRLNLFSMGSFSLDLLGNTLSVSSRLPGYLLSDMYSLASGSRSMPRIQGIIDAIRTQGKAGASALRTRDRSKLYSLPEDIEKELGITASGESIPLISSKRISLPGGRSVGVDPVLSAPLRLKAASDSMFGRTFALADLFSSARVEASKKGLRGQDKTDFIHEFVSNPTQKGRDSAIDTGKKMKFNRDLSDFEEKVSQSMGVVTFFDTFPRWGFQFGRWMGEMLGGAASPRFLKRLKQRQVTPQEFIETIANTATGWGGVYFVNNMMYDRVDFDTMEYINEQGDRVRLAGRAPIPDALLLNAMVRGDWTKAKLALKHTSLPGVKLVVGESTGIMSDFIDQMRMSMQGDYSAETFQRRFTDMVNRAIPGQAMLAAVRSMFDPVRREGIGSNIPGISTLFPAEIDPTTGQESIPQQNINIPFTNVGFNLPTIAGIPFPGATRVLNGIQQELLLHEIRLGKPTKRSLGGFTPSNVPKALRKEYEQLAGSHVNKMVGQFIQSEVYGKMRFDDQTDVLKELMSTALKTAEYELAMRHGLSTVGSKQDNIKQQSAPTFIQKRRQREALPTN